jgi:c(7)-type cytochrome triheme protein
MNRPRGVISHVMKNRTSYLIAVAVAVVAATALDQAISRAASPAKPGESVHVFDDPSFAEEQGKVEFSHLKHKESFGQEKLDCKPCHMTKPTPLFSMKKRKEGETRPTVTMADMEAGKACGGCHNGETTINGKVAFDVASEDNCSRCHVKE